MKRLLRVLALVACAGWAAGCGDAAPENTRKVPTEQEKARMMDQMKNMMPPQMKNEAGSSGGAKDDGDQDKAKDEPGEKSSKDDDGDAGKSDE